MSGPPLAGECDNERDIEFLVRLRAFGKSLGSRLIFLFLSGGLRQWYWYSGQTAGVERRAGCPVFCPQRYRSLHCAGTDVHRRQSVIGMTWRNSTAVPFPTRK